MKQGKRHFKERNLGRTIVLFKEDKARIIIDLGKTWKKRKRVKGFINELIGTLDHEIAHAFQPKYQRIEICEKEASFFEKFAQKQRL